jgi:two-component sensor histidine kinase
VYISRCIIESTDGEYFVSLSNIDKINYGNIIELPYNSYNLQFEYTALDYITPSKNSYKIILENYEENWGGESFTNNVKYNNINQGEYTFKVIGANNDGTWNEKGSSLVIIIQTPFWKTWWFILLISFSVIGFLLLFVTNQIKNALALERLRTKLAADLHDNIGSSLTEISILSEVISTRIKSSDKEIIRNLEGISHKSRSLIDKMSDIVWLVNPQRDTLYDLILRLQDTYSDLLSDTEISFVCKNLKSLENVTLSMENRQHLFLIFKEAINNSINHSDCSELVLVANVSGKKLTMSLKDNGKGFNLSNGKNGNGLNNMKNRSAKIGGILSVKSDLGFGTIVEYIGNIK